MKNQSKRTSFIAVFQLVKPIITFVFILTLSFTMGCKDDEPSTDQQTAVSFLGENYTISTGTIFDYGAVNYVDFEDPTHYNYDFIIHNGTLDNDAEIFEGSFLMVAELLSPGTNEFEPGSFRYLTPDVVEDVEGEFYFDVAAVFLDGNDNNTIFDTTQDQSDDLVYLATGGTVTVRENSENNYTLEYDLTLVQAAFESDEIIEGTETSIAFSITTDFELVEVPPTGRQANRMRLIKR